MKVRSKRSARRKSRKLFLNIPFDKQFEPLYLAFIAGLCGFGLTPQAVVQLPGSERRLDRILHLMRNCPFSFHDLSRVEIDPHRPPTPRFNMPFELGLAVSWQRFGNHHHRWFVFEGKNRRLQKSLSDLNGTEIYIHNSTPVGVLREMTNALSRSKPRPTVPELQAVYRDIKKASERIKKNLRSKSLFESRAFFDLLLAANASARSRIASLRHEAGSKISHRDWKS